MVIHFRRLRRERRMLASALALARITVGQSYTIGLLEPLTAGLLGLFFLGETVTAVQAAGMALEFACMALAGWDALHKN